jgi:hypothetical protein
VQHTDVMTQQRVAENEVIFRDANERIDAAGEKLAIRGPVPFICECGDRTCTQIVRLMPDAYANIREDPRRFFTVPGHESIAVDTNAGVVVARENGYVIVEKIGAAAEIAEETYDRSSD